MVNADKNETYLVEKFGPLHIYYANKPFKHWKKRWLHLQDQQLSIYQDYRHKRLEKSVNIENFRVSITNPSDSISQKGYSFKLYDPNSPNNKPIFFAADSKQSMTQWINALRLSASIGPDLIVESHFATDLHPIDTDSESDHDGSINLNKYPRSESKSYKPSMPVAATTTLTDQHRLMGSNDEEEDSHGEDHRWYRPRSSSPPRVSFSMNNNIIHQPPTTTMGSWGFDVNRSTNVGQPPSSSSFTSNNNINSDHRTITRTSKRSDETNAAYNEHSVDRSTPASPPPPQPVQRFRLRTPTLTRQREGNDNPVVDRLVLGQSRMIQSDYYPSDESPRPSNVTPAPRSRQSSTRSILRRRSKSIGDFVAPTTSTSPPSSSYLAPQTSHQYQYQERPETSSHYNPHHHYQQRTYTEQELLAWQNRMLEREQRTNPAQINRPSSTNPTWSQSQSPRMNSKRGGFNSSQPPNRVMPISTRPVSAMSNASGSQRLEYEQHEPRTKSIRLIKRYIELLYHLQTFYERIIDHLYSGSGPSRNTLSAQQSVFSQHCRRIGEQLQRTRPTWERKMIDLQRLLHDLSSHPRSTWKTETTFLQRRSTLLNSMQMLNTQKELDETQLTILNDIERVLNDDKLATQLQDELSTLLQHQSLLNDFSSLLQWNRQIYSTNEQNRVENVLPLLREQITTTDGYVSNVSQQLTELVTNLRSLEKYILAYLNTMPWFDENLGSSNRTSWRPYKESDIDSMKTRQPVDRVKPVQDDYVRTSRHQSRPLSMHTPVNVAYQMKPNSPTYQHQTNHTNEAYEWRRRSPSPSKTRSVSMTRYPEPMEPNRQPLPENLDRDGQRASNKWSPRRVNTHLNTNNSNNNPSSSRMATVKPARRDYGHVPNSILKPYPSVRTTIETKKEIDIDTIDKEIFKPDKVEIPDRLIDFDNDDQMLTPNERLAKMKKKEEVRKMLSKQSMQEMNDHDYVDGQFYSPHHYRRIDKEREKALNLQAALAEEAKEKSRQVAAKHYLNKSYQQRSVRLNN